jgi:hypothetical protein
LWVIGSMPIKADIFEIAHIVTMTVGIPSRIEIRQGVSIPSSS